MTRFASRALAAAFVALFAWPASAQEEPFEPEPLARQLPPDPGVSGFDPFAPAALAAIRVYQTDVGVHSIARCPYRVSCSHYAVMQIRRFGLLVGLAYFADRFFFRENEEALHHYGRVGMPDGSLKLDDDVP